jgi:serine protease Do
MNVCRVVLIAVLLSAVTPRVAGRAAHAGGPFAVAIDAAAARVVKLYGAGFGRERGYGSGVLVSADGRIVTTLSVLLESPALRAVLSDGRRYPARVVRRDELRQLALLQIEADGLPFFELGPSRDLETGDWVVAAANPFKVAEGPEPISIAVGVLSGRTELTARRRAQDFAYEGPVLLTDVIVATPGSAGGALVDVAGRFVGLIGKPVISKRTNTWMNYALPSEQIAAFVNAPPAGAPAQATREQPPAGGARPDLGILLFDVGGRGRPAYVERVRPDSPALRAGVCPNDLILSLAGEPIGTCADFREARAQLRVGQRVELVIKRGDEVKAMELTVEARE